MRQLINSIHIHNAFRLISLGGKKIEPVGVDYILQKLGLYIYICDACRLISLGGKKIEPVGVDYILQKLGLCIYIYM